MCATCICVVKIFEEYEVVGVERVKRNVAQERKSKNPASYARLRNA
jgi:hypothetical protein